MSDVDDVVARRGRHPNHIAHSAVDMTAPCPACGRPARWFGSCVHAGGATSWTVQCRCKETR